MHPSSLLILLALLPTVAARAQTPVTLDQAMAHPDWIGPAVESPRWSWDGRGVYYDLKRAGSPLRDTWFKPLTGEASRLEDAALARADTDAPVYDTARSRMAFVRHGDVFVRDLHDGALTQVTRSAGEEAQPQFSADGRSLQFRVGNDWFAWNAADRLLSPLALPVADKDPAAAPATDSMRDMQLRLIATLKRQNEDRETQRLREQQLRKFDPSYAAAPVYLGEGLQIDATSLSPDGRWLLVVTSAKGTDAGRVGKLPRYVTESGYEETEDQRTRVGRNLPTAQSLRLVDLANRSVRVLSYDGLPGIAKDPLAALRAAQKLDPIKGNRPVRIETDGDGQGPAIHWTDDGAQAAVLVRAVDNKDRWMTTVDFTGASLRAVHRLTDPAWINWNFNEFGWLPDKRTLWYLSEESGYSHLYTLVPGGKRNTLTGGNWEVSAVRWSADGSSAYFLCNRKWPGDYEVCSATRDGSATRELSSLDGVEGFALSPDGKQLLVTWSSSYLPAQLAVVPAAGGEALQLTDTRSAGFRAREWIQPQFVQVPSTHGAGTIWAKLYRPAQLEAGRKYPVVMFVHGAGYLQNVSARYPNYFREQMFHSLLVQRGYLVLDMDYRASEGYGRDWRTAIYRQMGHPELDDYLDGVHWMIAHQQGDGARVGIYGGSYGGFMTLMALFREPGVFKAGAALRPVSDWTQYNHEYTSNILNTPELDPEAYKISSPIEYASGLQDSLLIAHGMIDDNVFFKDSVDMTQKLVELHKDKWSIAPYPLERHSFVHADAWYDEYRRVYELFELRLK